MISERTLQQIGDAAISLIREQIDAHTDIDGKPYKPYNRAYYLRKKRKKSASDSELKAVDFTVTGNTRAALTVLGVDEKNGTIKIGLSNPEAAQTMFYHNVSGAGRGRVLRRNLGLQKKNRERLEQIAATLLRDDTVFIKHIEGLLNAGL